MPKQASSHKFTLSSELHINFLQVLPQPNPTTDRDHWWIQKQLGQNGHGTWQGRARGRILH